VESAKGFEQVLAELEARVRRLESSDVPLDEALRLFEEGVELARTCHEHLATAERRVAALSRGQSGVTETPVREPED
jgi:exodeoxyribonuclease VII small subunit